MINEVVTDPQQDWNGGGFTATPGGDAVTSGDEWVELYNAGSSSVDLSGWSIEFVDTSPVTYVLGAAGPVLVFSAGSLTDFPPGARCVIGDPPGAMNNSIYLVLRDAGANLVDDTELGDDLEADGIGDGAPDGSAQGGDATSVADETVARIPNGIDTDNDIADFNRSAATIGEVNDDAVGVEWSVTGFALTVSPNPLHSTGLLQLRLAEPTFVRLVVHDVAGREVQALHDGVLSAHGHTWILFAKSMPSGVYFVRLTINGRPTRNLRFVTIN